LATHAVLADITEIGPGNGYAAGGNTATFSSGAQTTGTYKLVLADVTFHGIGRQHERLSLRCALQRDAVEPAQAADCVLGLRHEYHHHQRQ